MEEYEIDGESICPKCGHSPIHYRDCTNFCEEGYIDEAENDPINYYPGELETKCEECRGTGIETWCPSCGENLSGIKLSEADQQTPNP